MEISPGSDIMTFRVGVGKPRATFIAMMPAIKDKQ
jgi:hypothetical protein